MEDNKMYAKPQYKCAICGKTYKTVSERATCEMACSKRLEEEQKKLIEAQKQAEKYKRREELTKKIADTNQALQDFIRDYGSYSYGGNEINNLSHLLLNYFF